MKMKSLFYAHAKKFFDQGHSDLFRKKIRKTIAISDPPRGVFRQSGRARKYRKTMSILEVHLSSSDFHLGVEVTSLGNYWRITARERHQERTSRSCGNEEVPVGCSTVYSSSSWASEINSH